MSEHTIHHAIPLFRNQVVQKQSQQLHGEILLARPFSLTLLTGSVAIVAVAIVLFFILFGYTRKVPVTGVVVATAGVTRVVPPQPGTIAEVRVGEGQSVAQGDVLFVLSSERSSAVGGEAETQIGRLLTTRREALSREGEQTGTQIRQRIEAANRKAADLEAESIRIQEQIALQQRRVTLAEEAQKRYGDLQAANFISRAQVQDKAAELLDQQQRLRDLERLRAANGRDLNAVRAEVADLRVQGKREQLAAERNIAAIEQDMAENEARRSLVIRAPQAGVVSAITVDVGQAVGAQQSLAVLMPQNARLEAELYAPSRAVGFLRPDLPVQVRYQAFPYQKFGQHAGHVREVSRAALRPEELPAALVARGQGGEAVYRVRVVLDKQTVLAYGKEEALMPGMALEASLVLEERKLYEWMLEPLFSVTGRWRS